MNFTIIRDPMSIKDTEVQVQLEICLVGMPNRNLNADEVRNISESVRQNDQ